MWRGVSGEHMGLRIGRNTGRDLRVTIATTVVAVFSVCAVLIIPQLLTRIVGASSNYTAVPLSASELASNWSPDRTTPSGGYESISYAGRNDVLEMRVDTTNASPTTGFYRTEGIQRQIPTSDTLKADLYVDSTWVTKDVRAGLWAVGKSGASVTAYPIVEFVSGLGTGHTGWRTWNGGAWVNTATGYNADAWNTLEITLNKATHQFDIAINGSVIVSHADGGSDGIGAVILNSFNAANNDSAFNYAAHWSNLAYGKITADTPVHLRLNGDKPCGYATNVNYITPTWDAVQGATSYNYKVVTPSGAIYGPVSVGNVTSVSGPFGGEGLSTFSVQAVTPYGLSEWASPCAVTYDATSPAKPTLLSPGNNTFVNGALLVNKWNAASGAAKYTYQSYNNAAATQIRYTETTTNLQKSATNVANGTTFWWRVKAIDAAGNESAWSDLWKVTIDNVAPTATLGFTGVGPSVKSFTVQFNEAVIQSDAENPSNYFLNNWKPEWSFADLTGHAVVSYNAASRIATVTFTDAGWYVSGEQQWGVKNIRDLAGNAIVTTTAYSTPPAGPSAPGMPTAPTPTNNTTIHWSWTASTDPGSYVSGVEKYRYKLTRGSDLIVGETETTNLSAATAVPGDGDYVLHVWAVDVAGNAGSESTGLVTVDVTPPEVTVGPTYDIFDNEIQPDIMAGGDAASFAWTTSVSSEDVTISDPLVLRPTFTVHTDGTYEFTLTVKDAVGNETVKTFSFTYETPLPETINTATIPIVAEVTPFTDVTVTADTATAGGASAQSIVLRNANDGVPTEDVLGAQTKKNGEVLAAETAAVIAPTTQGWKILGILWYWWALMIAAVVAIWWFLARRFGTQAQDV